MLARKCLQWGVVAIFMAMIHPAISYATVFAGGRFGVGECRSTDGGSPNLAMNTGVEIGSFTETRFAKRVEFGLEVDQGICRFSTSNSTAVRLNTLGLMLKAGYGYKSGEAMMVTWGFAVGPSQASYAAAKDNYDIKSTSTVVGLDARVGVMAQMMITEDVSAVGGFDLLHSELDVTSVKIDPAGGPLDKHDYQQALGLNIPEFFIGVRVNL